MVRLLKEIKAKGRDVKNRGLDVKGVQVTLHSDLSWTYKLKFCKTAYSATNSFLLLFMGLDD